jgi:hypothetical protein
MKEDASLQSRIVRCPVNNNRRGALQLGLAGTQKNCPYKIDSLNIEIKD